MSSTRYYCIEALDTLFFRDGKPFNAGEESWTTGPFPPMPSVVYGALRSIYFSENMDQIAKAGESGDPSAKLQVQYVGLKVNDSPIYPFPSDIVFEKDDDAFAKPMFLQLMESKKMFAASSYPQECGNILQSPHSTKLKELGSKAFMSQAEFSNYIKGKIAKPTCEMKDVVTSEAKIGLGRENTQRKAEEGMLYMLHMQRPQTMSTKLTFIVGFENLNLQAKRCIERMGGEGKQVYITEIQAPATVQFPLSQGSNEVFKMYLATPAVFREGWYPKNLFAQWNVELLAASIGKPISVGGWDIRKKGPKAMMKAVPAGSVYYLKAKSGTLGENIERQHGKPLVDAVSITDQHTREGFGIVYFAKLQKS